MESGSSGVVFEDFFPLMVEKLGVEGLMKELSKGFRLLMDTEKGAITLKSLKRDSDVVVLKGMSNEDSMIREGDLDGDGVLDEREFCVLTFRLTCLMDINSRELLEEAIA